MPFFPLPILFKLVAFVSVLLLIAVLGWRNH